MLDLNDVALFVEVVRGGSFAAAARRLGLPPNTISRRLQDFERRVGQRLLQRSTRRMAPTSAGQALFAKCAQQVDALVQSSRELTEGANEPRGKVRVGAPADFFNWYSMDLVAEFLSLHPRVALEFVLSDARADLLAEGASEGGARGALASLVSPDPLPPRRNPTHADRSKRHARSARRAS